HPLVPATAISRSPAWTAGIRIWIPAPKLPLAVEVPISVTPLEDGVGVFVGVGITPLVGVAVGVDVGVDVGVNVAVAVAEVVGVRVLVDEGVAVPVDVGVLLAVLVGVAVTVGEAVGVRVAVFVRVGVGDTVTEPTRRTSSTYTVGRLLLSAFFNWTVW